MKASSHQSHKPSKTDSHHDKHSKGEVKPKATGEPHDPPGHNQSENLMHAQAAEKEAKEEEAREEAEKKKQAAASKA